MQRGGAPESRSAASFGRAAHGEVTGDRRVGASLARRARSSAKGIVTISGPHERRTTVGA